MDKRAYIGHPSQLSGVEEVRLCGGKGDGMRLFQVQNGRGMELTVAADRCADIYRLRFKGDNMGYFSANGYVAPAYYDDQGAGFLKSFTAGFLTTCGLSTAGSGSVDEGVALPLHGTIGNTPCEHIYWTQDEENIYIHAQISEEQIFGTKLHLTRVITCSKQENTFTLSDTVENRGDAPTPVMLLYHINMGYPLLSENAVLDIPSATVTPRDAHAAKDLETWRQLLPPTPGFQEQCYFHSFEGEGRASVYNPDIRKKLTLTFDKNTLDHFTQWKLMGYRDYVLGLEPSNCALAGRAALRQAGELKFLQPGQKQTYVVKVALTEE